MAASGALYNLLFRKNYVFLGVVFASAFAFEIGFDKSIDRIWDRTNAGRQWKDIRSRYVQSAEEDDE
ncbi:BgTH12-05964 [Blumeria graminis f. sp. triticale]|uniref:Complex III subunit 9 n=1 Tax=Blumeria graminis f. sp. triticale TaxID=1689686 RepID=A0A9W4GGQ4_BLUGR|nr:BgTH12-05964 [Blumeria graminis f. sp. triticale]